MNRHGIFIFIALTLGTQVLIAKDVASAKDKVTSFYKSYFIWKPSSKTPKPKMKYSKGFRELVAKDAKLCKQKAGTDICGWGADFDIYFDSQENDDDLTFEKAHARVDEPKAGEVVVQFDLFPSQKGEEKGSRKISFRMIQEGGTWVVDDIVYAEGTARKMIQDEMALYQKQKK